MTETKKKIQEKKIGENLNHADITQVKPVGPRTNKSNWYLYFR